MLIAFKTNQNASFHLGKPNEAVNTLNEAKIPTQNKSNFTGLAVTS